MEFGPYGDLYALSQGEYDPGTPPGAPAKANTGRLLKVKADGSFCTISSKLDRPTSLDFSAGHAHVVTLSGEVLQFRHLTLVSDLLCGWR